MKPRPPRRIARSARPQLETLEDRCLPAAPGLSSLSLPNLGPIANRRIRRALAAAPAQEQYLLSLTNDLRRRLGLSSLTFDGALGHAARLQANALASFSGLPLEGTVHEASGGDVGMRARAAGYAWTSVAENVFSTNYPGQPEVQLMRALRGWLASSSHRVNLLDSAYREVGFGIARSADGFLHIVAVFGSRV